MSLSPFRRFLPFVACAAFALPVAAVAAPPAFTGPSGWSQVTVPSPTTTRTIQQWHLSGDNTTSLTYIDDSTQSYASALATIEANFTTNKIKPSVDKDVPCRGTTGHVVEFAFGPNGQQSIVNRLLIPDGPGVATITYTRGQGNTFDDDVKKAETTFCAGTS